MNVGLYRKRAVVIEAAQFTGVNAQELLAWIGPGAYLVRGLYIATPEGEMRVDVGDWVIRGVAGEHYPCKPYIFSVTYDPVDSDG